MPGLPEAPAQAQGDKRRVFWLLRLPGLQTHISNGPRWQARFQPQISFGEKIMKTLSILLLMLAVSCPCFASSCPDIQESANGAMQSRNNRVSETHNTAMPDPEEEREAFQTVCKQSRRLAILLPLASSCRALTRLFPACAERLIPLSSKKSMSCKIRH